MCNFYRPHQSLSPNPSPVQVISWDPSRPWRGPAHQSAQLDDRLYLQGRLWGPHHLSLGVWGWGSQPAHQQGVITLLYKGKGSKALLDRSCFCCTNDALWMVIILFFQDVLLASASWYAVDITFL